MTDYWKDDDEDGPYSHHPEELRKGALGEKQLRALKSFIGMTSQHYKEEEEMKVKSQQFDDIVERVRLQIMDELAGGLNKQDYMVGAFLKLHMNDCANMREQIERLRRRSIPEAKPVSAIDPKYLDNQLNGVHSAISDAYKKIKELEDKLENPHELLRMKIDSFNLGDKKHEQKETRIS